MWLWILVGCLVPLVVSVDVVSSAVGFFNIASGVTQYEYGPSIILENGVFYTFYCSPSPNSPTSWDSIRMITSGDGINWSAPTVAIMPSDSWDGESDCDPSVVKYNGVYFLYHTCINDKAPDGYTNNRICVAMADSIEGPYHKYGQPIVQDLTCSPTDTSIYCVGQPSAVVFNNMIYLYFTEAISATLPGPNPGDNGVNFTWANNRNPVFMQRDVDVKYERSTNQLFMVQGDVGDSHITWSTSSDGIDWIPYNVTNAIETNPQLPAGGTNNNAGIASLSDGSFSGMTFVAYGSSYEVGWGDWHLYRTDILVDPSINDCSKCAATSCDLQCSLFNATTPEGHCGIPGSTNPVECCACEVEPATPNCSACADGCVNDCVVAGFFTGICGIPGSTNRLACCTCLN